jgi:hypothetical protein
MPHARTLIIPGRDHNKAVGDKVYKLKGAADQLKQYAGAKVTVSGEVKGDTVRVAKVAPAK